MKELLKFVKSVFRTSCSVFDINKSDPSPQPTTVALPTKGYGVVVARIKLLFHKLHAILLYFVKMATSFGVRKYFSKITSETKCDKFCIRTLRKKVRIESKLPNRQNT